MVVIGLWVSEEENAQSAAIDLHNTLALEIRKQKVRAWNLHHPIHRADEKLL
jgi:hypothetical protein